MARRKKTGMTGAVQQAAGLTVGAAVAAKVANINLPVPAAVKPALPILLGFFLMKRGGFIGNVGAGMIAVGGTKLLGAVVPQLGITGSGDETISEYVIEGADDYALAGDEMISDERITGYNPSYALAGMDVNTDELG